MNARTRLAVVALAVLAACSEGSGGPAPGIVAATINLGSGSEAGGSGTIVAVVDVGSGAPIPGATVTLNGTRLPYDAASGLYAGLVAPGPGEAVTLSVSTGGRTYTATGQQFTTFPTITSPAPSATWPAACSNTITWTEGAPETGGTYQVLVLDPAGSTRLDAEVPPSQDSLPLPAGTFTAGEWTVVVGLQQPEIPVDGAAPGSALIIMGGEAAPVTVSQTGYRSVAILPAGPGVAPGGSRQLTAQAESCEFGTEGIRIDVTQTATWSTANPAVATVSDSPGTRGLLTGVAQGQTTVSASYEGMRGDSPVGVRLFTPHPLPPDEGWLGAVTWTGSQLVAVGSSGRVATSPDGVSWTARESGTQIGLGSVAASPQAIVATGGYASVFRSVDGVSWAEVPASPDYALSSVVWTGSLFVAVGANGTIVTSPDGLTWTARSSGTTAHLQGVAWSGTRLVAVGWPTGAPVLDGVTTSTDGISWTPQGNTPGGNSFNDVAFGPGGFVAVRGGMAVTSPDGLAWTLMPALEDAVLIAGGPEGFVATRVFAGLITSVDGRTWISYEGTGVSGYGVAFLQGQAVIVGSNTSVLTTPWP